MNVPRLESPRVKITTGTLTSNKLAQLTPSHPFTQKLEVLFPENKALEAALAKLESSYAKGLFKLSEIVSNASNFVNATEPQSNILALSSEKNAGDAWCIDYRGILTLFLAKDSHQRMGIMGKTLPFKIAKDERVVQISLRRGADTPANIARRNAALDAWEKRLKEVRGTAKWHVSYCSKDPGTVLHPLPVTDAAIHGIEIHQMTCRAGKLRDVCIPDAVELKPFPTGDGVDVTDNGEDWNAYMHALFEWVGMACLGSQRLNCNNRVDPYIALYEPPSPSKRGNLTHMRWQGLMPPSFVQLIIDTVLSFLKSTGLGEHEPVPFVSISAHAITNTPLSYINPKNPSAVPGGAEALRVPRQDGEDTWCLFATYDARTTSKENTADWVLVESLDKLDSRWGG
ncbi:hypothetical protein AX17_001771 [Amanita inopinata Kibby_2008]|nr:hypothetical protein AX17_001771 [Amanita inopinata Kibby_2008]